MSDKNDIFGISVRVDESIPVNDFHFAHPDGRIDVFSVVEGEVLPIHLTKLGDAPNWACPSCSHVNEQKAAACELCGMSVN